MADKTPYWNWLRNSSPIADRLRWCHVTDAYALRSMIWNDSSIVPKLCPVFHEDLTYLFYGRAAYRFRETEQIRTTAKAPIVLIFSNAIEKFGTRIYPFDTGAFQDRYKNYAHTEMTLPQFEMPCGDFASERHVQVFFENAKRYLSMEPRRPTTPYYGEFEAEAVAELLVDPSSEIADDRRLAVELQLNGDLKLAPPNLAALVIPDHLVNAPWFTEWRNNVGSGVDLLTYELSPRKTTGHYQSELESLTNCLVFEKSTAASINTRPSLPAI